jgi:putative acetyltransferase
MSAAFDSSADLARIPLIRRAASNADCAEVAALVRQVLAEHGLAADRGAMDADLDDLERHYWARGGRFDVLCDGAGRVVGTVGLHPLGATRVELRKMYLAPEHRGRGHGRALLDHALAEARRLGFVRVELETSGALAAAIALYRRYGFTPIEQRRGGSSCDQAFALDIR